MARRKRRHFTAEQKAEAVRLANRVGNVAQVARDLDLHPNLLRGWMKQAEIDAGRGPADALTTEEKKLVQQLMKENERLRMERDFLKRPQPSSPARMTQHLRADRGGEGEVWCSIHVPAAGRFAQRL